MFQAVDAISGVLSRIAQAVTVVLVASMVYEVAARYVFGAPTMWAFDISYMATGTLFVLGAAGAMREDAHVRIDFLASKMAPGLRRAVEGAVFTLCLMPVFALLTQVATARAWRAFETGEVESVSPWAPMMWPFYSLLAIGLAALTLQLLVHGLRAFAGRTASTAMKLEA